MNADDSWKPIETAPRGRLLIMCLAGEDRSFIGYADSGTWFDVNGRQRQPTHWQEMPKPIELER